jgi:hypothetical protein
MLSQATEARYRLAPRAGRRITRNYSPASFRSRNVRSPAVTESRLRQTIPSILSRSSCSMVPRRSIANRRLPKNHETLQPGLPLLPMAHHSNRLLRRTGNGDVEATNCRSHRERDTNICLRGGRTYSSTRSSGASPICPRPRCSHHSGHERYRIHLAVHAHGVYRQYRRAGTGT